MHLANDSPSFTPVHPQTRAIGPRDLHHAKGRGLTGWDPVLNRDVGEQRAGALLLTSHQGVAVAPFWQGWDGFSANS